MFTVATAELEWYSISGSMDLLSSRFITLIAQTFAIELASFTLVAPKSYPSPLPPPCWLGS